MADAQDANRKNSPRPAVRPFVGPGMEGAEQRPLRRPRTPQSRPAVAPFIPPGSAPPRPAPTTDGARSPTAVRPAAPLNAPATPSGAEFVAAALETVAHWVRAGQLPVARVEEAAGEAAALAAALAALLGVRP